MCRDYNPRTCECAVALTKLYLSFGRMDKAYAEMIGLIRTDRVERQFLNTYKEWDCDVPNLGLEVLGTYYSQMQTAMSAEDAKYIIMLVS